MARACSVSSILCVMSRSGIIVGVLTIAGGAEQRVNISWLRFHFAPTTLFYSSKIVFSAFFKGILVCRPGVHLFYPLCDMRPGFADDATGH